MDTFFRTRTVTSTRQKFIATNTGAYWNKGYVIQNLGPAKVTLSFAAGSAAEDHCDIRAGDFLEIYCCWADIQIASGESLDAAILQWQPVS